MHIAPFLAFDGQCADAMAFYAQCLGDRVTDSRTYGGSPMAEHVPAEMGGKLMYAEVTAGDVRLMASDTPPGRYRAPQGISVALTLDSIEDTERVFQALSEHGRVDMPMAPTFWATRFGALTDKFGVTWLVNFENR